MGLGFGRAQIRRGRERESLRTREGGHESHRQAGTTSSSQTYRLPAEDFVSARAAFRWGGQAVWQRLYTSTDRSPRLTRARSWIVIERCSGLAAWRAPDCSRRLSLRASWSPGYPNGRVARRPPACTPVTARSAKSACFKPAPMNARPTATAGPENDACRLTTSRRACPACLPSARRASVRAAHVASMAPAARLATRS